MAAIHFRTLLLAARRGTGTVAGAPAVAVAVGMLAAMLVGGCAAGTTAPPTQSAAQSAAPTAAEATAPDVAPATPTVASTPASTPTPTAAPTPPPAAAPTPTPTAEPTPEPTPQLPDALILSPDGITGAPLGSDPITAIGAITRVLGPPSLDLGWEPSFSTYGTCPGEKIRVVGWTSLLLLFSNGTTAFGAEPNPHLFEIRYSGFYGGEGDDGGQPVPIRTQVGISLGSTQADLKAAYGANVEFEPENEILGPSFHVGPFGPGGLYGFLDETTDDARILEIAVGQPCGE